MFNRRSPEETAGKQVTDQEAQKVPRRLFIARAAELCSAAPLLALGVNNSFSHRDYATIDERQALSGVVATQPERQQLIQEIERVSQAIGELRDAYTAAYQKERVVSDTTIDSKGHTSVRLRTETYWDEQSGVPDHSEIESWQTFVTALVNKCRELSKPDLIDLAKIGNLQVHTEHAGSVSQIGGSLLITATGVAVLLGYEELVGLREYGRRQHGEEAESLEQMRRGFLKYGVAAVAAGAALVVSERIDSRLEAGTQRMSQALDQAVENGEISRESAFQGYFRTDPLSIRGKLGTYHQQISHALTKGVRDQGVRRAMNNFVSQTKLAEESIAALFKDGIPADIAHWCKSAIVTKAVREATSSEFRLGEFGVLIEGLAAGGAMTAMIVASEGVNRYLTRSS